MIKEVTADVTNAIVDIGTAIANGAVAETIILATILEDILTWGIGIWNDALSFAAAASSTVPIIMGGLRLYGYAQLML